MTYLDDLHDKSDRIEDHREAVDAYFGAGHPDDEDFPIDDEPIVRALSYLSRDDLDRIRELMADGDELGAQRLILDRLTNRRAELDLEVREYERSLTRTPQR